MVSLLSFIASTAALKPELTRYSQILTMRKICFGILLILVLPYALCGQDLMEKQRSKTMLAYSGDKNTLSRLPGDTMKSGEKKFIPNPRKAALLNTFAPGAGQLYNRDYWKAPLVWVALAAGAWTAVYWRVRYIDFVKAYKSFYDLNPLDTATYGKLKSGLTVYSSQPVFYRGGILNGERNEAQELTLDQVKRTKDDYRRYFERTVVITVVLYAMSILEANVAAHLKSFDLSDDLTLNLSPKMNQPMINRPVPGIRVVFNFK